MSTVGWDRAPIRKAKPREALMRWAAGIRRFDGRSGRWEYWIIAILAGLISLALSALVSGAGVHVRHGIEFVFSISSYLGLMTITVRRLHDMGQPGWWFVSVVPFEAFYLFGLIHTPSKTVAAIGGVGNARK